MPLLSTSNEIAVITIGTEVTTGQIENTNAGWLARQLTDLGYDVVAHGSVPDDESLIIKMLNSLAGSMPKIVVTGGLGPTSDDKTRDALGAWSGRPLIYNESLWEPIRQRFVSLGRIPPASNKRQCYFPEGSKIISNPIGTAAGFRLEEGSTSVWVLPGPPTEIKAIWDNSLQEEFADLLQPSLRKKLFRFHIMGQTESAIAEMVEDIVRDTEITTGYRPHFPYLEVKIWLPVNEISRYQSQLLQIETILQPWLKGKDDDDIALTLVQKLIVYPEVQIFDGGSFGFLGERLGPILRHMRKDLTTSEISILAEYGASSAADEWMEEMFQLADVDTLCLFLAPVYADHTWRIGWIYNGVSATATRNFPYASSSADRYQKFQAEDALYWWHQSLTGQLKGLN